MAPVNPLPIMVIEVPEAPEVGVKEVITGAGMVDGVVVDWDTDPVYEKLPLEIAAPPGACTIMAVARLLVPRSGTIAVIVESEFTM